MKNIKLIYSVTLITLFSLCSLGATSDEKRLQYFETYGWIMGKQTGLKQLKVSPDELEIFLKGFNNGRDDKAEPADIRSLQQEMNSYFRDRAAKNRPAGTASTGSGGSTSKAVQDAKAEGKAYIENLMKENSNVKKAISGLCYEITKPGNDNKPGSRDRVQVHYEGRLIDGKVFDSSYKRGQPSSFGLNQVIRGWTEGLQLIGEGGKVTLYIPSNLAYGDRGNPSIPGGSTLVFDVELISIVEKAKPAKKKARATVVTEPISVTAAGVKDIEDLKKKNNNKRKMK